MKSWSLSNLYKKTANNVSKKLTGYATESNKKIYLLFYASDSRHKQHVFLKKDNEVLLQVGYDVIVIWPPGGHDFS